mgnify:CR=1 FL=1
MRIVKIETFIAGNPWKNWLFTRVWTDDGIYGVDGKVLAGPPPRPLDVLTTRLEGADLQAQYQDFRVGTPEQAPA